MPLKLPPAGSTTEAHALAYLEAGWSLFPVRPRDKRPLAEALPLDQEGNPTWRPFQDRRPTAEEVRGWVEGWPDMNLGVVTGMISGIVALDLDGPEGVASLRAASVETPRTLLQRTPHGWHALYALNGKPIRNATGIFPHVDVRGEGGYIVAAPSTLADGRYLWQRECELTTVPRWLETARPESGTTAGADAAEAQPTWVRQALEHGAPKGQRNATAARLVGYLHGRGLPPDVIATLVAPFAARCDPPLGQRELQIVIASVTRYRVTARSLGIIDPPAFRELGDTYRYEWESLGIHLELRAFHPERDGLSCELTIGSSLPTTPARVHGPVRFNLLSTTTRSNLCNYLQRQRMPEVDWASLVEDASRLAVETHRSGEPLGYLRDAPDLQGDGWLLPPLVIGDGPSMWFAHGDSGKSLLALAAAVSLDTGDSLLGMAPAAPKRVAYLDWEWDSARHKRRLSRLVGPDGVTRSTIYYRKCRGPLVDQVDTLRRLFAQEEIETAVLDSVAPGCDGPPEEAQAAIAYMKAVEQLRVPCLLIAHNNKGGDEHMPFGSVFWFNTVRCLWFLKKTQEPGANIVELGLFSRKQNDGGLQRPIGLRLTFENDRVAIERTNAVWEHPDLAGTLPMRQRLLQAFRRGDMTAGELAVLLDVDVKLIQPWLTRLKKDGAIINRDGHRWGLLAHQGDEGESSDVG